MWMLFLFIRILSITCVCGYEYEDYYPGKEEAEVRSDMKPGQTFQTSYIVSNQDCSVFQWL